MESIRKLICSVEDASRFIQLNDKQKIAFQEARHEYKNGNFHSADDLFNDLFNDKIWSYVAKRNIKQIKQFMNCWNSYPVTYGLGLS